MTEDFTEQDVAQLRHALEAMSDLREWLRTGNAYMEHPDGQEGTDRAVDAMDYVVDRLILMRRLLKDDAHAMTFQTLGQYRKALMRALVGATP